MKAAAIGIERERRLAKLPAYELTTAVSGPRTVYRAVIDVKLDVPLPASGIVFDPTSARLEGSFSPLDVDVADSQLADSDTGVVVVTLDGPREVRRIDFTSAVPAGAVAKLLRIDKDVPAPQATVQGTVASGNSVELSGFTDVRFAVGVQDKSLQKSAVDVLTVRGQPTGPKLGLVDPRQPDVVTFFWPGGGDSGTDVHAGAAFAKALQTHTAQRTGERSLSVQLVLQSDQPCGFDLAELKTAASFAVDGFAFPALVATDLSEAALAARIQAAADPVSAYLHESIGRADLLDGLNAVVAGPSLFDASRFAGIALSPETSAELAAGTDVPRLNRLLLQDAFPGLVVPPAEQRVLRFKRGSLGEAAVSVRLPPAARVSKATVKTQESLRGDRLPDAHPIEAAGERAGVHVAGDGTVAAVIAIETAVTATGLALPLLPLATGTEVGVELQEDWHGEASGKVLARGTFLLGSSEATWATAFFDPVVLPSGDVWVVLRAGKGEAVWLAARGSGLRIVRSTATEAILPGLQPLFEIFSRGAAASARPATTLTLGGVTVSAERDGDHSTYDIAATLESALAASASGVVSLTFASSVEGTITVYPPHVEYAT